MGSSRRISLTLRSHPKGIFTLQPQGPMDFGDPFVR